MVWVCRSGTETSTSDRPAGRDCRPSSEFGREQKLKVENLGDEPVFSEFRVTNRKTGGIYRVAIRGAQPGDNFCACPGHFGVERVLVPSYGHHDR